MMWQMGEAIPAMLSGYTWDHLQQLQCPSPVLGLHSRSRILGSTQTPMNNLSKLHIVFLYIQVQEKKNISWEPGVLCQCPRSASSVPPLSLGFPFNQERLDCMILVAFPTQTFPGSFITPSIPVHPHLTVGFLVVAGPKDSRDSLG